MAEITRIVDPGQQRNQTTRPTAETIGRSVIAVQSEPLAYSLTADAGNFTVAGNTAGLLGTRKLTADAGSFTLTGSATGFLAKRTLPAASGTFTLTGAATGLLTKRTMAAAVGSFTLTGQAATLTVTAAPTSRQYALGGLFSFYLDDRGIRQAAVFGQYVNQTFQGAVQSYSLTASVGAFTLSGAAAGVLRKNTLTAASGSFVLTGGTISPPVARRLSVASGSFVFTGGGASLSTGLTVGAAAGAFTLSGAAASFARTSRLSAAAGSFALTGANAGLTYTPIPISGSGRQYALAGLSPAYVNETSRRHYALGAVFLTETALPAGILTASAGSFVLSGAAANLLGGLRLSAAGGSFAFSGGAATLTATSEPPIIIVLPGGGAIQQEPLRHRRLHAEPGRFRLRMGDARLLAGRRIKTEPGSFSLSAGETEITLQLFDTVGHDNDFLLMAA